MFIDTVPGGRRPSFRNRNPKFCQPPQSPNPQPHGFRNSMNPHFILIIVIVIVIVIVIMIIIIIILSGARYL